MKQVEMIINDIEVFGECYLGSYSEKNEKLLKKINKLWSEQHGNNTIIVWDIETGMCFPTK